MKVTDWLRDKFSWSKLDTFARCPRKAFYRYIVRAPEGYVDAFARGGATHAGQEHDNRERAAGRRPPKKEVLDVAVTRFEERLEEKPPEVPGDLDEFREEHEAQLTKYWESGARDEFQPVADAIEAEWELEVAVTHDPEAEPPRKALIGGFVDVVGMTEEEERLLIDYKTVTRRTSDLEADKSLQLVLYSLGAEAELGRIVSFIKRGRQKPGAYATRPIGFPQWKVQRVLTFVADTLAAFRRCLVSGDWPKCSPQCHWCSSSTCAYYDKCYPAKDPTLHKFISISEIRPVGSLEDRDQSWRLDKGKKKG